MDIGIDEAIRRVERFGDKLADLAVELMRIEAPHRTGALRRSIHKEKLSDEEYFIGTDLTNEEGFPYPKAVVTGRREIVMPRDSKGAKVLRWYEAGEPVFSMRSSATEPNDFVTRAENALKNANVEI